MNARIKNLFSYCKAYGLVPAVKKVVTFISDAIKRKKYQRFVQGLDGRDAASVFSEIYRRQFWRVRASFSGAGSEIEYTENLRMSLPIVFERFGVQAIVDAACGDFTWMQLVPLARNIFYVGMDIVPEVIRVNQDKYGDGQRRFIAADITRDPLPRGDILICRDCLFHLSNRDIVLVLKNFVNSTIPYLLTNTHINVGHFVNTDIKTGEFRRVDLFSEPFCFPKHVHYRIEDFVPPYPPREMCLWSREQIRNALEEMSNRVAVL